LKESLATVGELTAGIAHEFRNGLATIHGYSKLVDLNVLARGLSAVRGRHPRRDRIALPGGHQLPELRAAGAADADRGRPWRHLRAGPRQRSGPTPAPLGGDVVVHGECGVVEGDEVLLRQANQQPVCANALEACAESGAPRIANPVRRRCGEQGIADLGDRQTVPACRRGLRERIFQPFFTMKRNGTGLGLALVQKIIVFHNGRIVVGTAPQGGASFQITLPLA